MSTFREALQYLSASAVQATLVLNSKMTGESRLTLTSAECHILIVLVWNPNSLHLFQDRLRPEVLKLALSICWLVRGEQCGMCNGATFLNEHALDGEFMGQYRCPDCENYEVARSFIKEVDEAWPQMAKARR